MGRTQRIPLNNRLELIVIKRGENKGVVHFRARSGFNFTLKKEEAKITARALADLIGVD